MKSGDSFNNGTPFEMRPLEMSFGGFRASKEKEIIDDLAEMLTLDNGRFDHLAVFLRGA